MQWFKQCPKLNVIRMIIPNGVHGTVNSVGNIINASSKIVGRARFVEARTSVASTIDQINLVVMLMAVAITTVTKKLDQIEEAQINIQYNSK